MTATITDRYPWIRGVVDHGILANQMVPIAELRPLLAERDRLRSYADAAEAAVAGRPGALEQLLAEATGRTVTEVVAMAEVVSATAQVEVLRRHAEGADLG